MGATFVDPQNVDLLSCFRPARLKPKEYSQVEVLTTRLSETTLIPYAVA